MLSIFPYDAVVKKKSAFGGGGGGVITATNVLKERVAQLPKAVDDLQWRHLYHHQGDASTPQQHLNHRPHIPDCNGGPQREEGVHYPTVAPFLYTTPFIDPVCS